MSEDSTVEAFLVVYRTLSEKEIRRRQMLCEAQIGTAFAARNDGALGRLRNMEEALTAAMLERC